MSFYVLGKNTENETFIFKGTIVNNSKEEKILGVTIDNRLTLAVTSDNYVKKRLKNSLFCLLSNQLNDSEKNLLFNAAVKSQLTIALLFGSSVQEHRII